jgi:glutamine synthetase type III
VDEAENRQQVWAKQLMMNSEVTNHTAYQMVCILHSTSEPQAHIKEAMPHVVASMGNLYASTPSCG